MVSLCAFSQENAQSDSLHTFSIPSSELEAAKKNATFLLISPVNQITRIALEYQNTSGSFRKVQMPGNSNQISFSANGIKTLSRFKLYGDFEYTRAEDGELAYSLRGEGSDDQPFYQIVGFPSKFTRQKYHAKGIISYNLLNEKLYFSSGFNYIYYLAYRSVDPRMSLNWFDFQMKPELTFLVKNWNIGLSGLWGYGNETTSIRYKRRDYSTGTFYEDRTTYMNYGYGYTPIFSSSFSRKKAYKGAGLHAAGKSNLWNIFLNIDFTEASDKNQQSLDQSLKNIYYSDYTSNTWTGGLLLTRRYQRNEKQIAFNYTNLNGEDYVYDLFGKNYTTRNKEASISFTNTDHLQSSTVEWGTFLNYRNTYKKDAVSAHLFEYSYLQPGINAGFYKKLADRSRYQVNLSPSVILPFATTATAPLTQQTVFAPAIMFPDYIYHSITAGVVNLRLGYINNTWSKSFKTGISLNSTYTQAIKRPEVTVPAKTIPGNERFSSKLSLNLYF